MSRELPTVRIKKAILKDFKSVHYGEVLFNCGKTFIPEGTDPDILGIYGQNGSGKTSLIEALGILKWAMSADDVPEIYADCVSSDADHAELSFTFDLQYPSGMIREVTYAFSLKKAALSEKSIYESIYDEMEDFKAAFDDLIPSIKEKVVIYNEQILMKWESSSKRQVIIDTSSEDDVFKPDTKRKIIVGNDKKVLAKLLAAKDLLRENSKSFIFSADFFNTIKDTCEDVIFRNVLLDLFLFAKRYLFVVDTKDTGFIRMDTTMLICDRANQYLFPLSKPKIISLEDYSNINKIIEAEGLVLNALVPGLTIVLKPVEKTFDDDGKPAISTLLMTKRGDKELPLRVESDGVRKIIFLLNYLIMAFNQKSTTIAIDEFDEGIFEYLLGEILQAFSEAGKGQLVFTSHNLRPLEVLNKKYLCFTTTNPDNRYVRLKNIAETNNLRDTYFREIIVSEQEEELYNRTKKAKIIAAFRSAGGK